MRFRRLVDLLVSLQIFGSDKPFAAVYADAISGAVPASMVAARVSRQHAGLLSDCFALWSGIRRTHSRSDLEVKVLLQFSQASVATDLEREREVLRLLVGVVAGGARVPKLVRSETL
jgi:hypothetical protein